MARVTSIPGTRPSVGAAIGSGLGEGLNLLLGQMIQKKLQKKQQQQTATGLQALGIPQAEAAQISLLPPQLQQTVVGNYMQAAEGTGLGQALSALEPGAGAVGPESGVDAIGERLPEQPEVGVPDLGIGDAVAPRIPEVVAPPKKRETFQQIISKPRLSKEDKLKVSAMRQRKRQFERKMSLEERKFESAKQDKIDASTKDSYKKILSDEKGARENDMRLNRMAALNRKKLTGPVTKGFIDLLQKGVFGVGLDLSGLQNPDSQEFDKISKDFLKNAKAIFGARVTQGEIELFLKTVPGLNQSKAGRNRVIRNLKLFNEGAKIRKKAMDDIIKLNSGKRPANLESLVEKKAAPKLDRLASRFTSEISEYEQEAKKEEVSFPGQIGKRLGEARDLVFGL